MRRKFYKMHGIGNDYVYFNCLRKELPYPARLAITLSDRHFSVGGDGVILICKSKIADAKMRIFNADGSEGKTCGNGVRCVGKFLYDFGIVKRKEVTVETLGGVARLWLFTDKTDKVIRVKADMGRANFLTEAIPARFPQKKAIGVRLNVEGKIYTATCVNVGNPHCVIFTPPPTDFARVGAAIEKSDYFPERVNVEFVEVISPQEIRLRVWERGSGETLACGSGACAAVSAAVASGYCREGEDVLAHLQGGTLTVNYTKNAIYMTGSATFVYAGVVEI
ncbi:MAG: diaminopimelate epimerase [Clostridia bacterium]|nr:diaminopimelate epimerase [Clostridia bacterium]